MWASLPGVCRPIGSPLCIRIGSVFSKDRVQARLAGAVEHFVLGEGVTTGLPESLGMEKLPGRMQVERKLACPHCRKLLPDFAAQEILESKEYPLRCGECRRVVELSSEYIESVRRSQAGA